MLSGLNVTSINDKDQPVSLQQSKQLIELIKQKIKQKETTKKEEQKTQKATQTQKFSHSELQKLIEIAEKAEKEAQIIEEKAAATISPNQIKVLHELRNELQKYKRGTNADKISKTLKGLFQTMEEIEMEMIENNKETETKLIQQSMISNIDVLTEYNKRQKADKIHKV